MSEVGGSLLGFRISYLQSGSKMKNRPRSSGNCSVFCCWPESKQIWCPLRLAAQNVKSSNTETIGPYWTIDKKKMNKTAKNNQICERQCRLRRILWVSLVVQSAHKDSMKIQKRGAVTSRRTEGAFDAWRPGK